MANLIKGALKVILNDTTYPFLEESYKKTLEAKLQSLSDVRREGCFTGRDRQHIHYQVFRKDAPSAAMVLCHDGCESSLRYLEWACLFYDLGYQVYLFDFRGHGRSTRRVSNRSVTHISDFDEYARDLADLTSRIDRKLPLCLTAFGMGGLVALRYLQKNPRRVQSACMVSPLLSIVLPAPRGLYRYRLSRSVKKGLAKELLPGSDCYCSDETFQRSGWHSFARFAWYREARIADSDLQNSAYTMGWLKAALDASDRVFSCPTKQIASRILLIEAGEDRIVPADAYEKLLRLLPRAHYLRLAEAEHRIQNGDPKTLSDLMSLIAKFFTD